MSNSGNTETSPLSEARPDRPAGDAMVRSKQAESDRKPENPRGILRGYFTSLDDVERWIEEERAGWVEREAELVRSYRELVAGSDRRPT